MSNSTMTTPRLLLVVLFAQCLALPIWSSPPGVAQTDRSEDADRVPEAADSADEEASPLGLVDATDPLSADEERWLREVDPLITPQERALYRSLRRSHQRDAFRREFWKVRDPYPRTVRNELKERWPMRLAEVASLYGSLTDDRSRLLLAQGPPQASFQVRCTETRRPVEVWIYRGTDWTDVSTALIFLRRGGQGEARLWRPGYSGPGVEQAIQRVRGCIGGPQMLQVMNFVLQDPQQYERDLTRLLAKPRPSSTEWVQSFVACRPICRTTSSCSAESSRSSTPVGTSCAR